MTEVVQAIRAFREGNIAKGEDYMRLFILNNPLREDVPFFKRTDAEFLSGQFQMILGHKQKDNTTSLDLADRELITITQLPIEELIEKWRQRNDEI